MSAYRQDSYFTEDEYGEVKHTFVISDVYEELFGESFIMTNIFDLNEGSKDLEESEGVQVEDEEQFKINETWVETEDDEAALAFTLLGTNPANKRFVAVFINTGDIPSIDDADFTGVLRPDFKGTEVLRHGEMFTTTPNPVYVWDVSAQSFFTNVFDSVALEDLVYGNEELLVEKLSDDWIEANVANQEGYARTGSGRITKYCALVNLNRILHQMSLQLSETLTAQGLGDYVINIETTTMDFKLSPARWFHVTKYGKHPRYTSIYNDDPSYNVKAHDAFSIKIGDNTVSDAESIHVSYCLFDPKFVAQPPGIDAKSYAFTGNLKLFTDLLYAIAAATGCFVEFSYTDSVTLNVAFRPRGSVVKDPVYIRDVVKADLNTKPRNSKEDAKYYANANGFCAEGAGSYLWLINGRSYSPSSTMKSPKKGNRLALSLSTLVRQVEAGNDDGWIMDGAKFPHNVIFYDGSSPADRGGDNEVVDSKGITTGIYIKVPSNGEYGFTGGEEIYAPAAAITAKIDGVDMLFQGQADYVNFITGRDKISFDTEYNLTVPFLCGFRQLQDGTGANDDGGRGSWKNLRLGSKVPMGAFEYVVVGLKRSRKKPETSLRLHHISRFSYGEAEALSDEITSTPTSTYMRGGLITDIASGVKGNYVPGEAIIAGDFVSLMPDGKVYRTQSYHSHVLRCKGIATSDADETDETIPVLESGRFTSSRYTFLPSEPLFIRTAEYGTFNASHDCLDFTNETEDTYIHCASAVTSDTLLIERGFQFVYTPRIED